MYGKERVDLVELLEPAYDTLTVILLEETPDLVFRLAYIALQLQVLGGDHLLSQFFEYGRSLTAALLGEGHPLYLIWGQLVPTVVAGMGQTLAVVMRLMVDVCEAQTTNPQDLLVHLAGEYLMIRSWVPMLEARGWPTYALRDFLRLLLQQVVRIIRQRCASGRYAGPEEAFGNIAEFDVVAPVLEEMKKYYYRCEAREAGEGAALVRGKQQPSPSPSSAIGNGVIVAMETTLPKVKEETESGGEGGDEVDFVSQQQVPTPPTTVTSSGSDVGSETAQDDDDMLPDVTDHLHRVLNLCLYRGRTKAIDDLESGFSMMMIKDEFMNYAGSGAAGKNRALYGQRMLNSMGE
jgi:hypothetical protein